MSLFDIFNKKNIGETLGSLMDTAKEQASGLTKATPGGVGGLVGAGALGALLVVKGVLPEGGALAWGCGCWALATFAGGRVAVRGRGEGTLTAALAAGAAAYLLAWLVGAAIGDPTFRTGGLYLTAAIFGGAGAAGLLGSRPRKKRRDARPPIRKSVRRK